MMSTGSRPSKAPLEAYRKKRDFAHTPEPSGDAGEGSGDLFVVQKHAARRLHYDFRLALDGTLKSWAIAKGPSLDPGQKRLAVHVEDHPLDYAGFEGTIPKGEYGGGTVMIWDRGRWCPEDDPHQGYAEGKLKFRLEGEKLRGRWMLVRMGGRARQERADNWLLIKERDDEARGPEDPDILDRMPLSVATGRSLDEITEDTPPKAKTRRESSPEPAASAATSKTDTGGGRARIKGARKAPLPDQVGPQLATLASRPPRGDGWVHEIKFDGYRILCRIDEGQVRLLTRGGEDWTHRLRALGEQARRLPVSTALIDGEIVVDDGKGVSDFGALQEALSLGRDGDIVYHVFDLLHLDGRDLLGAPLLERKTALASILEGQGGDHPAIRYSDHLSHDGDQTFRHACRLALEGIVSKRADAPYRSGRSRDWLKIRCIERQEFVIGGFVPSAADRAAIGALLVGFHDGRGLAYAGRVGTGFTTAAARDLRRRLDALRRGDPPFMALPPGDRRGVVWVDPVLVAEVEFSAWTRAGLLRHASFKGLREDKKADQVVQERRSPAPGARELSDAEIGGVRLSNPERVLFPAQGLTKLGLAEFYAEIAGWILPQVADRPLSIVRCPQGRERKCFYQKHAAAGVPDAVRRVPIAEKEGETAEYLAVSDLTGLISLVQLGVLELHPWGAKADDIERPDRLVFDLDPAEDVAWEAVIEGAVEVRDRLAAMGLESFVKTTGGKGLHVVVPIQRRHGWDEAKAFTRALVEVMVRESPERYTASLAKAARRGKIFVDYLRNERGATAIAAYSTRARPGAPVATPLDWSELQPGLRSDHFTVANLPRRLARLAQDPWAGMMALRQSITARARRAVGL